MFFLGFLGWIPFAFLALVIYSMFNGSGDRFPGWLAIIVWMIVMFTLQKRVTSLKCPGCGNNAFHHGLFFMRHAKCTSCGLAYEKAL